MGRWVVVQPNTLYAVFSTVVDSFVLTGATEEELRADLFEHFNYGAADIEAAIFRAQHDYFTGYRQGPRPLPTVLSRWTEALETIEDIHGIEERRRFEEIGNA